MFEYSRVVENPLVIPNIAEEKFLTAACHGASVTAVVTSVSKHFQYCFLPSIVDNNVRKIVQATPAPGGPQIDSCVDLTFQHHANTQHPFLLYLFQLAKGRDPDR